MNFRNGLYIFAGLFAIFIISFIILMIMSEKSSFKELFRNENIEGIPFDEYFPEQDESQSFDEFNSVSNGGEYSENGCEKEQIAYALKNPTKDYICDNMESYDSCVKNKINCSVEVQNLDYQMEGEFEIKFSFYDESTILFESVKSDVLGPREKKIYNEYYEVQTDEFQNLSCSFVSIKVPYREFCN